MGLSIHIFRILTKTSWEHKTVLFLEFFGYQSFYSDGVYFDFSYILAACKIWKIRITN